MAMRDSAGRPDDAITPAVTLVGQSAPMGHVITVLNKAPMHSQTPEMRHMVKSTFDPAQRRDKALRYFSSAYYQKAREFSETLTATFLPDSEGASALIAAQSCMLTFDAYAQRFELHCDVRQLGEQSPLYEATWWHNSLFNPNLNRATIILGFTADWQQSRADPPIIARKTEEVQR